VGAPLVKGVGEGRGVMGVMVDEGQDARVEQYLHSPGAIVV